MSSHRRCRFAPLYWTAVLVILTLPWPCGRQCTAAGVGLIPLRIDRTEVPAADGLVSATAVPASPRPRSDRMLFSRQGDPARSHLPFRDRKLDSTDEKSLGPIPGLAGRLSALTDPRGLRRIEGMLAAETDPTKVSVPGLRLPAVGDTRPTPDKDLPWTPDQLLANPTNMNDEHVSLAENPVTGHLFAVFAAADLGGTDRDIHISRSTDGGANWTTWEMPSSSGDEYHPDLAIDAAGYIHVIWIRDDGSLMRARTSAPDNPAAWTNVFSFVVGEPLAIPSLAVSGAGDFAKLFIAVDWQTLNYDYYWYEWTLLFLHSTNGGLSLNYDYFLPDGYEDLWPTVAMDGGTVHFVNAEVDLYTGETEILIATDAYNGGFADPGLLSGWTSNNCGFPAVACQGDDVFVVYQHDYTDGLTTDGDIIYSYSWDVGASFFGPYGLVADEYESVGPTVFTRVEWSAACGWTRRPAGTSSNSPAAWAQAAGTPT